MACISLLMLFGYSIFRTSLHAAESSRNYGNSVPPPSSYGKISLYAFLLLPLLPLGINLLLTLELSSHLAETSDILFIS